MTGTPVWEHVTDRRDLLQLRPGVPPQLDRRPDVLIVGGGVVGLATAVYCRRLGLKRVVVLERGSRLAGGASAGAGGALLPGLHAMTETREFAVLSRRSLDLYRELDLEWGGAIGLRTTNILVLDADEQGVDPGPRAEVLTSADLVTEEPALVGVGTAVRIRDQAHVNPLRLAAALARHAGTLVTGVESLGFRVRGSRVSGVETSVGRFHPGAVVLATGLALTSWVSIPQVRVKGHLLAMAASALRLRHGLAARRLGVGTLPTGELLAGGTHDHGDEPDVDSEVITAIAARVRDLLPDTGSAAITHRWSCFRPTTADGYPAIDRLPSVENGWINVGHGGNGILTSAAAGWAVASAIESGSLPADVRHFNVARFGEPGWERVRAGRAEDVRLPPRCKHEKGRDG